MKRNFTLYLKDIYESINSIEIFTKNMTLERFKKDDKTSSAVMRKFEIIGEAAKKIPENIQKKYNKVPWKTLSAFRDKLIHFYFGINYKIVWNTIKYNLPILKRQIKEILKSEK